MAPRPRSSKHRPRQRRKAARPAEIIEAGLAEFAKHGFAATKLDDVAKRAGVAKGTIYIYFDDKESLFIAAVRSRILPVFDQVNAFVDSYEGSRAELLETVIRTFYARIVEADLAVLLRIMIAEGAAFPQLTELYYRESVAKGRALIEKIVKQGIRSGEFRNGPATRLSIVLVAPAIMAAVWRMTFDRVAPIGIDQFMAAHIDLIRQGLLKAD
jgi:AcrR family transcriptional regulator